MGFNAGNYMLKTIESLGSQLWSIGNFQIRYCRYSQETEKEQLKMSHFPCSSDIYDLQEKMESG